MTCSPPGSAIRAPVRLCCGIVIVLVAVCLLCCAVPVAAGSGTAPPAGPAVTAASGTAPVPDFAGDYPEATALLRGFFAGIREAMENDSFLILLQLTGVIIIVAFFLTRSRFFPAILDGNPSRRIQILLVLLFGALSVYGTLSGIEVEGSYINVRDLGPMVAGLLAGPYVGVAAGLIGAAYRLTLGGFTVCACSLAAVLAGLFGGLIWLRYRKKFCGITVAVFFAVSMELFHMALILLLSHPFDEALRVVWAVVLPMILANATGVFIFAVMVENVQNERRMQAQRDDLLRERERRDTELAIAAGIQKDFLPAELPATGGFSIAAKNIPVKEVGGDFYDVIPLSGPAGDEKTAVLIADVSGKGMPAALFMALSQTVIRVLSAPASPPCRPGEGSRRDHCIAVPVRHVRDALLRPARKKPPLALVRQRRPQRTAALPFRPGIRRGTPRNRPGARDHRQGPVPGVRGAARSRRSPRPVHGRDHGGCQRRRRRVRHGPAYGNGAAERLPHAAGDNGRGDRGRDRLCRVGAAGRRYHYHGYTGRMRPDRRAGAPGALSRSG